MINDPAASGAIRPSHGQARLAGAVYSIVILSGLFSLGYAPSRIFQGETAEAMAKSVVANEGLLRLSIAAELTCYVAFLLLAITLYRLLVGTDRFAAMVMAALALSSIPFGFSNVVNLVEILRAVDAGTLQPVIGASYERYQIGNYIQSIPWGLWLIPFGYLVVRSRFLPWPLGVLLMLGGVGYVANFAGRLLFESYDASGLGPLFRAARFGEILICLWLLLLGARPGPALGRFAPFSASRRHAGDGQG